MRMSKAGEAKAVSAEKKTCPMLTFLSSSEQNKMALLRLLVVPCTCPHASPSFASVTETLSKVLSRPSLSCLAPGLGCLCMCDALANLLASLEIWRKSGFPPRPRCIAEQSNHMPDTDTHPTHPHTPQSTRSGRPGHKGKRGGRTRATRPAGAKCDKPKSHSPTQDKQTYATIMSPLFQAPLCPTDSLCAFARGMDRHTHTHL